MPKIVFIGAGSTVFARNLLGDILSFPELADATLSFSISLTSTTDCRRPLQTTTHR
jgi:hypothetical protein